VRCGDGGSPAEGGRAQTTLLFITLKDAGRRGGGGDDASRGCRDANSTYTQTQPDRS